MIWRLEVFFLRLFDYIFCLPQKIVRVIRWIFGYPVLPGKHKFLRRATGLFFLLADITPLPFFLENFLDWIKIKTRPFNDREKAIARELFGRKFPVSLMGVDPASIPARNRKTVAYVTFHTVNYDAQIPEPTFAHELVHIWQYRKHGAAYITESIWAQKWGGGYNYGGLDMLKKYSEGKGLGAFNYEQQADIIEEYFRWKNNLSLQWMPNIPGIGDVLEKYREQVKMDRVDA